MPKLYRLAMSLILVITVLGAVPATFGQLIIPTDRRLPPPIGFSFDGTWTCGTGNSVASLKVATPDRSRRAHLTSQHWTGLQESQDWFHGRYLVGYDRDRSSFILIDLSDPAAMVYRTDGWQGNGLILTQVSDGGEPVSTYRVLFQIEDLQHFDVTWEESEGGVWHKDPPTVCRKLGQRTRSRHK